MTSHSRTCFDVVVVGAGPVGTVAAIAHARRGDYVALVEANAKSSLRLAGEWLHPLAVDSLRELDIDLPSMIADHARGNGFVVYPDSEASPQILPYSRHQQSLCCEHDELVDALRDAASGYSEITYFPNARVMGICGNELSVRVRHESTERTLKANRIIGADGRHSVVRKHLQHRDDGEVCSRMLGMILSDVTLPHEGMGHVWLGGPGPVLGYRIGSNKIRLMFDVPLREVRRTDRTAFLWENYAAVLPLAWSEPLKARLVSGELEGAANHLRVRSHYGEKHIYLVGDAVGHFHPLTAAGITLGFGDAICASKMNSVEQYAARRYQETKIPEMLAIGLHQTFSGTTEDALVARRAVYRLWRTSPAECERSMGYLSCEASPPAAFVKSYAHVTMYALLSVLNRLGKRTRWNEFFALTSSLGRQVAWAAQYAFRRSPMKKTPRWPSMPSQPLPKLTDPAVTCKNQSNGMPDPQPNHLHQPDGIDKQTCEGSTCSDRPTSDPDAQPILQPAIQWLIEMQDHEGKWEGEVEWCPMLAAQYVMAHTIMGRPIATERCLAILQHFRKTQLATGCWGFHPEGNNSLYVTTLVYVAARLLGVARDDALLEPSAKWIVSVGGVLAIPSWGKFWLAMLNLYEWQGVNPLLPELWSAPRWFPLFPGNYYCHTRVIYMAMTVIYASKHQTQATPLIQSLREELYPEGYARAPFRHARHRLHASDLYQAPGFFLKTGYAIAGWIERFHHPAWRRKRVDQLVQKMRWELQTTHQTCCSPVNGLLVRIALWIEDPNAPDCDPNGRELERWSWEDADKGWRLAGARSESWDTSFALQALRATLPLTSREVSTSLPYASANQAEAERSMEAGSYYLLSQQLLSNLPECQRHHRIDWQGGWCFAGAWHGWPVSDCTAEAAIGLMEGDKAGELAPRMCLAMDFILRCQNRDGGFGSYEPNGSRISLEWLNPAEMFGDCMTDHSWVECTASSLGALTEFQHRYPALALGSEIPNAIVAGRRWLERSQQADGSWLGAWGVHRIYGTLFGIRGLLASGVRTGDPAIREACQWLITRQRPDGGWGESPGGCRDGKYEEAPSSHVVQTAWAMLALLEAKDPNWEVLSRGASYLIQSWQANQGWPRQGMVGLFFKTALLDYAMYRVYFPIWALAKYEARRQERVALQTTRHGEEPAMPATPCSVATAQDEYA